MYRRNIDISLQREQLARILAVAVSAGEVGVDIVASSSSVDLSGLWRGLSLDS